MGRFGFRGALAAVFTSGAMLLSAAPTLAAAAKDRLFTLTSPALKDDAMLPAKYAGDNCGGGAGKNVSPPLAWSDAPASTKSFALIMIDPDGRRGLGSVHWVAYNIPATRHAIKEGEGNTPPQDITGGKNSRGTVTYTGPCGPPADAPHHYVIQLLALDLAPGFLQPGLDRDEVLKMINGHSLGPASLVVRYRRKP
ncbi:MAG TPA: YbhB/YbcL family Raf kinase inhibitor-like protein [Stellaceae bacterium]|jgi:Raf kinase inhibitor-like YbhB/YbcL family protein|nr:YbhB/YbcL family Raf kinase inhibitor-like protein [Stellaceae bacterium]